MYHQALIHLKTASLTWLAAESGEGSVIPFGPDPLKPQIRKDTKLFRVAENV